MDEFAQNSQNRSDNGFGQENHPTEFRRPMPAFISKRFCKSLRLFGIRQGMDVLGSEFPILKRQDLMPNGRIADMVFVEQSRITVVEIRRGWLKIQEDSETAEDVVGQICEYLKQCRIKYPGRRGVCQGIHSWNRCNNKSKWEKK